MNEVEQGLPTERALLAPWLRRVDDGSRLVLEYGDEFVTLGGEPARTVLDRLLPLLDGTRTPTELAATLDVPARQVGELLAELRRQRLVVDGPVAGAAATLLAALAGVAPSETDAALRGVRLAIVGQSACADELERILRPSLGAVERCDWETPFAADLAVAAPAPAELPRLQQWNARMLESRTTWSQILPFNGRFAGIGPLFVPGQTCCAACFEQRRGHAIGEPELVAALSREPAPYPQWGGLDAALAGLAATVLVRWIATGDPSAPGVLFALELADGLRVDAHRVLRLPRCPVCSPAAGRAAPLPWAA